MLRAERAPAQVDGTQDARVTSPRAAIVSVVTPEPVQKPDMGENMPSYPSGTWWPPMSAGHNPKQHHRHLHCHHPRQCLHRFPLLSAPDAAGALQP
ncbi:unnamed protein product [Rangifer tarandus platyrhynchus]|uniref:Uncharacterized protein n=2 Tax=Rangifer tarandus platyrhynchus TaxID=3082113 RepID=A0ABN8Y3I6_RANTA|nr:unnamed protein product [Rangifer tarandus platyrhynchus]CAI9692761.1 unnamed protein product [Rangifer tarandus platyrhynchus]